MSLNFLGAHEYGGGPAHLFANPAPRSCLLICLCNTCVAISALTVIVYGNYVNTSFGAEVPQYLLTVTIFGIYCSLYFARLGFLRLGSDNEWSRILLTVGLINLLHYGLVVWGAWLCYRMLWSQVLVGTRMYYYFRMGRWMANSILGISVLNCYCIIYTSYVALVEILVSLFAQRAKKKFVI